MEDYNLFVNCVGIGSFVYVERNTDYWQGKKFEKCQDNT